MGKTESACRAWELGRTKPDCDTLIKLAQYFECSTDYLLGLSEDRNADEKASSIEKMGEVEKLLAALSTADKMRFITILESILVGFKIATGKSVGGKPWDYDYRKQYLDAVYNVALQGQLALETLYYDPKSYSLIAQIRSNESIRKILNFYDETSNSLPQEFLDTPTDPPKNNPLG
jgi:transcriptional regulator with XRE-family HTH domain